MVPGGVADEIRSGHRATIVLRARVDLLATVASG